jgi:hypothetical protein
LLGINLLFFYFCRDNLRRLRLLFFNLRRDDFGRFRLFLFNFRWKDFRRLRFLLLYLWRLNLWWLGLFLFDFGYWSNLYLFFFFLNLSSRLSCLILLSFRGSGSWNGDIRCFESDSTSALLFVIK